MQMMPVGQPQVTIVSQQHQQPMQPVVMAQPPAYQRMLRCGVFILGHMYDVA